MRGVKRFQDQMAVRSSNSKDPAHKPAKSFEWPPEGGGQLPKATAPLNLATIWENSVGRDRDLGTEKALKTEGCCT